MTALKIGANPMTIVDAARGALAEGELLVQRAVGDLRPRRESASLAWPARAADPVVRSIEQRVAQALACVRRDRWPAAGLALTELRQWYEASDPAAFAEGERTWSGFTAKRLAIAPAEIERLIGDVQYRGSVLQCSGCGAHAVCRCGCGVPYVVEHPWAAPAPEPPPAPSALDRATAAILATPEKSDRAIAAAIGVSNQTVSRARRRMKAAERDVTPMSHPEPKAPQEEEVKSNPPTKTEREE
jgi:hypothetical protein